MLGVTLLQVILHYGSSLPLILDEVEVFPPAAAALRPPPPFLPLSLGTPSTWPLSLLALLCSPIIKA